MRTLLISFLSTLVILSCRKNNDINPITPTSPTLKTPIVTTNPISDLTLFSVTLSGKIVDTGGSKLIEQGLVVDTLPMPTTTKNLNKFIRQVNSSGEFNVNVTDIPANKNWYVRAYGINSQGIGYGQEVKFTSFAEKVFFGDVTLTNQNEVNAFGANNYTTIRGSIYLSGSITDLTPLNSVVIIGNGFEIKNTQLTNFNGLENLEIIGNEFTHSFRVENNQSLTNFFGLKKLKIVNGDFYILNNDALVNLIGLDDFTTSANFEFRIDGCNNITSINGLEKMQAVLGSIMLKDNPLLSDLRAWSNLATVSERIRIINNPSLQKLDGLEKIRKLEGIELINNPMLADIKGLRNIDTITQIIHIDNNDALKDLSPFNNITTTEYINIKNNDAISNFDGFKNLQTLKYQLLIENNSAITNFQGLRRLKSLSSLEILANNSLQNLNGLDSLTTITGNAYSITIGSNNNLQNLDGIQKLTVAQGSIQISNNLALVNFCGLKPLFVAGYNSFFLAQNNNSNPTQSQIISSCP